MRPAGGFSALVFGAACAMSAPGSEAAETGGEALVLDTFEQKAGYAIGLDIARTLRRQGIEVDTDGLVMGLRDGLAGETRMDEAEVRATMMAFQKRMRARLAKEQGGTDARRAEEAGENLKKARAFLARNAAREGVVTTASGLQYEVLRKGDGKSPGSQDTVVAHYKGTLADGTVFDSSYERGKPLEIRVDRVIAGWTEALQLMKVGAKWKLSIPPEIGYGEGGAGKIGPNEALIFEVELLGVK